MAHHVLGLEVGEADAVDVLEHLDDVRQATLGATRQVDLGDVAGDHGGGAEADPGQEHFHLLLGGVLALIEDDEAVVQRTPAHVGQRSDLDHLLLDQPRHVLEAEHFVERVVQRAQVGVDLLRQVARQEAELLAGLHRRAHQQDAAHLLAFQRVHRAGDRQVGLAGTGRAHAEIDVVVEDGLDVALLVGATRADHALLGAQRHALLGVRVGQFLHAGFLQVQVHHVRRQLGGLGLAVQAAQEVLGGLGHVARADQFELVAAVADFQLQALFDQAQMLVELAAEVGEATGFKGFEGETMRFYGCVQGLLYVAVIGEVVRERIALRAQCGKHSRAAGRSADAITPARDRHSQDSRLPRSECGSASSM